MKDLGNSLDFEMKKFSFETRSHGTFYLLRSNLEVYQLCKAEAYDESQFGMTIALLHLMASYFVMLMFEKNATQPLSL